MFLEGGVILLAIVGARMIFFKNRLGLTKKTVLDSLPVAGGILNPQEKFNTKIPSVDPLAKNVTQGNLWTSTIPGYKEKYAVLVDVAQNQYAHASLEETTQIYTRETPNARLMKDQL